MSKVITLQWRALGNRSPTLFLVGGGLVVGHAATKGVEAFTDLGAPADVFGPVGYLVALVGLFGLYPALADRTPRLARAATAVGAVTLAGWFVISAWSLGELAGILPPGPEVLPGAFYAVHIVSVILTYGLFGGASLRAGQSRTVGLLLLAVPVLLVAMMAGAAVAGNSALGAFLVGSGLALVHLAIGHSLRTRPAPAGREVPAGDVTAD